VVPDALAKQYVSLMERDRLRVQPAIAALVAEHSETIVGSGYRDIITRMSESDSFVNAISNLGVMINALTLWCDCTPENTARWGCPHGHGGPCYGKGCYFSEMCGELEFGVVEWDSLFDAFSTITGAIEAQRVRILEYLHEGIEHYHRYSPCLVPAFWLAVPKEWRSPDYRAIATPGD